MKWRFSSIAAKKSIGVDIGTSSIKIVELSSGVFGRKTLENYGEIKAESFFKETFRIFEKNTLALSDKDVSRAIRALLEEAGIKAKKAQFSIPDFASFFTWFELPAMSKEELPEAVTFEARQHIPVPVSEVNLDWQIIKGEAGKRDQPLKILLVAVPKEIINQYLNIATTAGLKIQSLEAEVFALQRGALKQEKKEGSILVDIGAQSTTVSVIKNQLLQSSHSFDTAGNELTASLARSLNIDRKKAEDLKEKHGIVPSEENIHKILLPLIDVILLEIEKIAQAQDAERKEIKKVIIGGASALLPGLTTYFSEKLQRPVETANPFSDIFYPPILEQKLKQMGPSYAIAVGMAKRAFK